MPRTSRSAWTSRRVPRSPRGSASFRKSYGLPLDPRRHVHTCPSASGSVSKSCAACCRRRAADHGRADLGATAAGGRAAVRDAAAARRLRAARSCTSRTSSRRSVRCAIARPSCAQARWSPTAIRRRETARSLADLMIGSEFRPARARAARPDGSRALARRRAGACAEPPVGTDLREHRVSTSRRRDPRYRRSCRQRPERAGRRALRRAAVVRTEAIWIDGRAAAVWAPTQRRDLGLACVPEERHGHGAVPEISLTENCLPHRRLGA